MDINFELYKIFYIAARAGSFSSAAKELFISQSAVSQSIKSLEENIGSPLFVRGSRNVKLTATGEMLFGHVEQAYNLIRAAEDKIEQMQSLSLGEIKIGVGDTILKYLLTPYLQQFIKEYPKIKIRIINRTSPGIINSLKKGTVDFGIVTLPLYDRELDITEFREVEDVFVASPRFIELKDKIIEISEMSKLPLLLLEKQSATRRNLDVYFSSRGFNITPEIELESIELLVEYARIGLGIAYVMKESVISLLENNELFILKTTESFPKRKLGIAKLSNVPLSPAAAQFVKKLE